MTAFLKIDRCRACPQESAWEWVPPVYLNGKALAGTAVWRSQLIDGQCPACFFAEELKRRANERAQLLREGLVELLGGEKPYRDFTFEKFAVAPGNQLAFGKSNAFRADTDNLYLWGPCGVGKTHLAYAIARRSFERNCHVTILRAPQLTRKVRMKEPQEEQAVIDRLARTNVLVLDDLGIGSDTPYSRQILQEILDARDFHDRNGLVITTKYSLGALAAKLDDDTIPSRLAGMCQVIETKGADRRLAAGLAQRSPP